MPVPESAAGTGETADERVTFTEPERLPAAEGVNVTVMVQDPPAPTLVHVFVWAKSLAFAPVIETAVTRIALWPTLLSVIVCGADLVPTFPKPTLGGVRLATVPCPLSVTTCGLPVALSVIESVPFTAPFDSGLNVTEIVHLAPTARDAVQVVVWANPPLGRIEVIETEVVPVFVTVTIFGALVVPLSWVPKVRLVGDKEIVVDA
jgi:hypothetical protein